MPQASLHDDKSRLRIALLIDDFVQPKWVCKIIDDIRQSKTAEIVLVIYRQRRTARSYKWFRKIWANRQILMWVFYQKLDRLLFHPTPCASDPAEMAPLVATCPKCSVTFDEDQAGNCVQNIVPNEINSYNLDVVLRFGAPLAADELPAKARYGTWLHQWGDNITCRGEPPCFWETFHNDQTTSVRLEMLHVESRQTKTLDQCWCGVDSISVTRNSNELCWSSVGMVRRKLNDLHSQGPWALEEGSSRVGYQPYSGPLYRPPTNGKMLSFLTKLAWRMALRRLTSLFYHRQWCLAYKTEVSSGNAEQFYNMNCLIPPRDRFWADPFPVELNGAYFIFIEEYVYQCHKGHISVIEMDPLGKWKPPVKILERPYHLSYPFVFLWNDEYYMIPETQGAESIELYKCLEFPWSWKLDRVLIQGVSAVDTTLYHYGGKWWMFTSIKNKEEPHNWNKLCLFFADCPVGPWHEHKKNPIISDARCARPAGRLFFHNGNVYRPAQDCSRRYGGAISIRRITRLDCAGYSEEETGRLEPCWSDHLRGIHTYNQAGRLITVDFLKMKSKFRVARGGDQILEGGDCSHGNLKAQRI